MVGFWLKNLKQFVTGTTVGSKYCADVNVANSSAIPVSSSENAQLEYRFQDFSDTGINALSGAYVEIGDSDHAASNIANTISKMKVANNSGAALLIGVGANAGAVTVLAAIQAGQTGEAVFGFSTALVSGDKLWVKALKDTAVAEGDLLVTLFG